MILNLKYVFNIVIILLITLAFNSCKSKKQLSNKSTKNIRTSSTKDSIKSLSNLNQIINYSEKKLNIEAPESLLGNFICDISMFSIKKDTKITHHPDFCVFNNKIFKAPINKGEVKAADIHKVFPSDHELIIIKINPENLNLFLKYLVKESFKEDSIHRGVSISGIRLKISSERQIKRCMVNTIEINQNKSYYLLTNLNHVNKIKGLGFLKNSVVEKTNLFLKEVVLKYIKQIYLDNININAELDGRIIITK